LKGLPRRNTLAYYENLQITSVKTFITLAQITTPRGSRAISAAKKMKTFLDIRQKNELKFRQEEHDQRIQVINLFITLL